jgi:ethanolamine utilization protein EutQ (cupin superfamily)
LKDLFNQEKDKEPKLKDIDKKLDDILTITNRLVRGDTDSSRLEQLIRNGFSEIKSQITQWRDQIMASMDKFQSALQSVDAETTRIGEYIKQALQGLNRTDLTDAQEQEILTGLEAAATRLQAVGKAEEPVPPGPELPPLNF